MVKVVCISFVHTNIERARISAIFKSIGWGTPNRIDIKARQTRWCQKKHNVVFIHFPVDIQDTQANSLLEAGQDVVVVYDSPWFWKVRKYFQQQERPTSRLAYVDFVVPSQPVSKMERKTGAWESTPMGDPIWSDCAAKMMVNMGWKGCGLGVTQQGRLAPVGWLASSRSENAYNPLTSISTDEANFQDDVMLLKADQDWCRARME